MRQRYGSFSGTLFEALQEWSAGHGDEDTDGGLDEISRDAGQSDDPGGVEQGIGDIISADHDQCADDIGRETQPCISADEQGDEAALYALDDQGGDGIRAVSAGQISQRAA